MDAIHVTKHLTKLATLVNKAAQEFFRSFLYAFLWYKSVKTVPSVNLSWDIWAKYGMNKQMIIKLAKFIYVYPKSTT